ncbi:ATP-binding protein [Streptomyces reniochalinae]|uniref:ATP-binding protein n=1 Tax=Streptomyces reniochalinae TaxID=2250578 RepID=A0A367F2Y4_9ACTN|nr:ATP-binding protein [Streptomyces reniochalinae]RCG23840.1 ATP-binding protein [Streptomyces reniochalinae]
MTMDRHASDRPPHGDQHEPTGEARGHSGPAPDADGPGGEAARAVRLVAEEYLVTVNPVDGSEVEPCPPGTRQEAPPKLAPSDRPVAETPASAAKLPPGSLVERDEERERLVRLLSRGRSVRLTGPAGSGRSVLLDVVADDVAHLAPDGVVRLSGHRRTPSDLMYDLFAAVHSAPLYRPGKTELVRALAGVGAIVLVDDLEFGGAALDELLRATPECAFLFAATPGVTAPAADSCVEEVFLAGLSRTACLDLLERAIHRQLTDEESDWAAGLWFDSEGMALRFVQAGALLRLQADGGVVPGLAGDAALAPPLAAALPESGREALRLALALDGEVPHPTHLPALTGDPSAEDSVTELLAFGLISPAGDHFKLAAGVAGQLAEAGYGEGRDAHALAAAQHYTWWAGHPSVSADRVTQEADALLAAARGAHHGGSSSAAVLLARTAAPVLAAGMRWSAWERMLRCGQESARASGELAEEAYFHHELGVLALAAGNPERARTELEAAIALRGTLPEQRGMVAGRRALALVNDLLASPGAASAAGAAGAAFGAWTRPAPAGGQAPADASAAPADAAPVAPQPGAVPPTGGTAPVVASADSADQTPGGTLISPSDQAFPASDAAGADAAGGPGRSGRHGAPRGWRALTSSKRNVAAAGAGALLAAVLGTVVTLGTVSDDSTPETVRPDASTSQDDQDDAPGDEAPGDEGDTGAPERRQPVAGTPSRDTGGPAAGERKSQAPTHETSHGKNTPSSPEESSSDPEDDPPSSPEDPPSSPDDPPSSPDDPPTSDDPSDPPTDDPTTQDPPSAPSSSGDGGNGDGGSASGTATGRAPSGGGTQPGTPSASGR